MNYTLYVEDMHCENCREKITNALKGLAEVSDISVDLDRKRVVLTSDAQPVKLINILDELGYNAAMDEER